MIKTIKKPTTNESSSLTQQEKTIASHGYKPMPFFLSRKKLNTVQEKSDALNEKIQSLL